MIHWKTISDVDARAAIANGEFADSVVGTRLFVALILTQSWCPQWTALKRDLEKISQTTERDIDIYVFIYDRSPLFYEFLDFKETRWRNDAIPYVRYYRDGRFQSDSNFVASEEFLSRL